VRPLELEVTMRRTLLLAGIPIALLLFGSMALIYWLTAATGGTGATPTTPAAPAALEQPSAAPGATAKSDASRPSWTGGAVVAPAPKPEASRPPPPRDRVATRTGPPSPITISFKLDPRLTAGLHLGERWVSPPKYAGVQRGEVFTVKARVQGVGPGGRRLGGAAWLATEPDMLAVSPERGDQVELTVLRAGESRLTVTGGGASKTLLVKAAHEDGVFRVDITQ
jgi:hypothetical protein